MNWSGFTTEAHIVWHDKQTTRRDFHIEKWKIPWNAIKKKPLNPQFKQHLADTNEQKQFYLNQ